jgi:hypothetical protein
MKPRLLLILLGAFVVWRLWAWRNAPRTSLREDKAAAPLPGSYDLLAGRPRVNAPFNLPTTPVGIAPLPRWDFDSVLAIFRENADGQNK